MNALCTCGALAAQVGQLKVSPTTKYVATIMLTQNITATKDLAAYCGLNIRAVQRALKEYRSVTSVGDTSVAKTTPVSSPRVRMRARKWNILRI